jgi:hypothetical protein
MRRKTGWISRAFLVIVVFFGIVIVFRQGWIPARYTPLPPLNIDRPFPLLVDWQLAELKHDAGLCRRVIEASQNIRARQRPPRPPRDGCGWTNAVRITQLGGTNIGIDAVSCEVAAALALWVTHEVQPLARQIFGSEVASITNFGTYSCRNVIGSRFWRNRRSEHAMANAIDISGFRLKNGTFISVRSDWKGDQKKSQFLRAVHQRGCRYFRVSLSPDFNRAHHDHFHFDRGFLWTCR